MMGECLSPLHTALAPSPLCAVHPLSTFAAPAALGRGTLCLLGPLRWVSLCLLLPHKPQPCPHPSPPSHPRSYLNASGTSVLCPQPAGLCRHSESPVSSVPGPHSSAGPDRPPDPPRIPLTAHAQATLRATSAPSSSPCNTVSPRWLQPARPLDIPVSQHQRTQQVPYAPQPLLQLSPPLALCPSRLHASPPNAAPGQVSQWVCWL